jgi:hypothetical protein
MSSLEKIQRMRTEYMLHKAKEFDRRLQVTESPIEALFLATMLLSGWDFAGQLQWTETCEWYDARYGGRHKAPAILAAGDCEASCLVQLPLPLEPACRVDFAFVVPWNGVRVAIELDGHDFHERTKEQASRDKARDRALVADGWRVMRFTGSDVHDDPWRVLDEVTRTISALGAAT